MTIWTAVILWIFIGIMVYTYFNEEVTKHTRKVDASSYITRLIYIVAFIITTILWPLLLGS